ncbi:MAG: 50S ribosomal protein L3 [Oscillospiraceae bacterium]|nr:50S ribosomal protein L3 [Oscillospiraceae bacterium]
MKKGIIGTKAGMTQLFDEGGRVVPVTVIRAGPCRVCQVKTQEKDGYPVYQLGYGETKEHRLSKGEKGHLAKSELPMLENLHEFSLDGDYSVGDTIEAKVFQPGERVDITGTSKGKGFAGVIKRHGFSRTATSHGGGPVHRHQGSMGASSDPSRVFPGKKLPGQTGNEQVTVMNLEIIKVDENLGIIAVRGAVPGPRHGLLYVRTSVKKA